MAINNDNYSLTWNYNYYQHCSACGAYYYGYHTCTIQTFPQYYCGGCGQYVTYNGHVCSGYSKLEVKPKYGEHTLECGCKVKTVVVEYCTDLHEDPDGSESS